MTRRWNVGSRYGEMGEMFFQLLHNDPFAKHWYYDSEGNKTYTMLKKRNPIMEGFRKKRSFMAPRLRIHRARPRRGGVFLGC